jgi:uncharacterized membrane protein
MIGSQRKRHIAAVEAAAAGAPPNQAVIENFSPLDRLAVRITDRVGTMSFFLVIFAWTVLWVGYNVLASKAPALHWHAFDPFPAFVAYLLISNVIQIWLMPLLMVGQNMQGRHSEARAEADYLVNQKAFADAEVILQRIESLDRRLLALEEAEQGILRHLLRLRALRHAAAGSGGRRRPPRDDRRLRPALSPWRTSPPGRDRAAWPDTSPSRPCRGALRGVRRPPGSRRCRC